MGEMNLEKYSRRKQFYSNEVPSLLLECMNRTQWSNLVDFGCGDGSLLHALDQQGYLQAKSVYALDLSEDRIDRVKEMNQEFTCLVADVCETNIDGGSVDLLLSTQVIEHVADDGEMVKEMRRILRPDGTVYLSTVFKKHYAWYFYRCNNKWTLDPTHLREYTEDNQLLALLEANGFEILANEKTQDSRPIADAVFRRLRVSKYVYKFPVMRLLRKIRVPIPGYYIWELVLKKKRSTMR